MSENDNERAAVKEQLPSGVTHISEPLKAILERLRPKHTERKGEAYGKIL